MNNLEMIKELRSITQAGMKDCKDSLEESNWDLQKAIDLVKKRGLNIVSGREGKIASEGAVVIANVIANSNNVVAMVEVNCQTDFVAKSDGFKSFAAAVADKCATNTAIGNVFQISDVEDARQSLVATTKENVVVRRWWVQQAFVENARVFHYTHSNNMIGALLTLLAPSVEVACSEEFTQLGNDLVMQVAAMNPLAVSTDHLNVDDVNRQKSIFEQQLFDLKKPQAAWSKILDGKLNKWYTEVCLLNQESVIVPKNTINQIIKNVSTKLGGDIQVVNFIRCQVGEGIVKETSNFADEISKMSGV